MGDEEAEIERLRVEKDRLESTKEDLRKKYHEGLAHKGKLSDDNADLHTQLNTRQDEINSLGKSKNKTHKQLDGLKKQKAAGDAETKRLEESRNTLKSEINHLTKQLDDLKRQSESDSKQITDLLHERNILNKSVIKGDERSKIQMELVTRHKGQANTLGKDLQRWKVELQLKLHRIHELDKQREKYASELSVAKERYEDACTELKKRDNYMAQLKKSIADVKAKLGQQKNLYEAVRTDKNLYSKNLSESVEEIAEMRKKFKVMYHQIEQLKEEIKEKDKALITEHFERQFINKETEKTKENLEKHVKLQKKSNQLVEHQQNEIKKLEATIQ